MAVHAAPKAHLGEHGSTQMAEHGSTLMAGHGSTQMAGHGSTLSTAPGRALLPEHACHAEASREHQP